jgi:3-dehydroquinate synthase
MKSEVVACITSRRSADIRLFIGEGLVEDARGIANLLRETGRSTHILISDHRVFRLHGENLLLRLRSFGLTIAVFLVRPGEKSKSLNSYQRLINRILMAGIDQNSCVITLGGGMVNNLGGFVAATLYRGLALVHLPTSLMAQVDAAIDRKQAVNHRLGKNLIGSYYSPRAVVIDPLLLQTLPTKQLRNGMAEAIKHALTQSPSFFRFLVRNADRLRDPAFLKTVIKRTIRLKLALMRPNGTSHDGEFIMQYGHCIGHALERSTNYALSHGEAIAIGMCVSAEVSLATRISGSELIDAHELILEKYQLPTVVPRGVKPTSVLKAVSYDKGILGGTPRFCLLRRVGEVYQAQAGCAVSVGWPVVKLSLRRNMDRIVRAGVKFVDFESL